ncbi:MAG: ABC transporter substrate-binding protein [Rickettsiales bacterium]|jgi:polar amino acid transport system substrate-binding protein|nr:ABC transporter substrate-binding protein [Rickettsiales bacterium]
MKKISLALLLLGGILSSVRAKSIKIAVVSGIPPYVYYDDNRQLTGFDIDVGKEISKRIGYDIEYSEMGFDAIIPSVESGRVDVVASALTITSTRAQKVDFSIPYLQSDENDTIMVLKDNKNINALKDLKGKKVGCVVGAVQCDTLEKIGGVEIVHHTNTNDTYLSLLTKKIDANLEPSSSHGVCMKSICKDKVKIVGEAVPGGQVGAAVKKGNKELLNKINKAIETMKRDGTLEKITLKYGFKYKI